MPLSHVSRESSSTFLALLRTPICMPFSPFPVRPASSLPAVGLFFARCLDPCGTTTKVSRLFHFAPQRGQSSSCAASRVVSKALRPAHWRLLSRDEIRCAVSKRAIRHLTSDAPPQSEEEASDAAAVSGNGNASPRPAAKWKLFTEIPTIVRPNVAATERKRRRLQRKIQYTFEDGQYFRACIGQEIKVGAHVLPRVQLQLAIIGDCLIKMIWYTERFPMPDPVRGNGRWSHIATNIALARRAYSLGLESLLELRREHGTTIASRTLGTLVEAIVGAVYLDSGHDYTATRDVMARLRLLDPAAMTRGVAHQPRRTDLKAQGSRRTIKRRNLRLKASQRLKPAPRHADPPSSTSGANLYAQFHV